MDNNNIENNEEFKRASKQEYYDQYLEPFMGFDYTKVSTKEGAKEYRKQIKEIYRNGKVDENNQYEKYMDPYFKQMNELMKNMKK